MNNQNNINYQFNEFLKVEDKLPSRDIDLNVLSSIKENMNPPFSIILSKLSLVHAFVGVITMAFCPQFSLSLTTNQRSFHYFHETFGYYGCMAICGIIFLGSGALFASFLLNRDEVRKVNRKFYLFFPTLCLLSLTVFFFLGAELFVKAIFSWSLGGIISSIALFYLGPLFKSIILKKFLT